MIKFKGLVIQVQDEQRDIADKDKDGNRLASTSKHRFTNITMLVDCEHGKRVVIVKGFDLSSNFKSPAEGKEWTTPEIVEYRARFRAVPEASIEG